MTDLQGISLSNGGSVQGMVPVLLSMEAGDIFTYDQMKWQVESLNIYTTYRGQEERTYGLVAQTPNKFGGIELLDIVMSKSSSGYGIVGMRGNFSYIQKS
jgi:hypothetical protein